MNALPSKTFSTGTKIRGSYMGAAFTGVVVGVESDASGYRDMMNVQRVTIQVDADIVAPEWTAECGTVVASFKRRSAGESIIMWCRSEAGSLVREDSRYEWVRVARAA